MIPTAPLEPPRIGCAGWSLSSAVAEAFPAQGTHLQRYGEVFNAVEINSSFYRPHKPETYAKWRDSVPDAFRFSVKIPKAISHEAKLRNIEELLQRFLGEVGHLEHKLGCLLLQLPPKLAFDADAADAFFTLLRDSVAAPVVCEPRHATWFEEAAAAVLARHGVAYVDADPRIGEAPAIEAPLAYIRLHGSPKIYYSAYDDAFLDVLAQRIALKARAGKQVWCVFDNTASGAAVPNALALMRRLELP
ncbi:DUF72 domain-containing protein [Oxalobacteraceae bacterium OM1]|nr:DUF72 domain-containing protein [Oxalobacteraceae bacterium OM1]